MGITQTTLRYLSATMIVLGLALPTQAITTSNLLTDPGWNIPMTNPLTSPANVLGPPYTQNTWGDENAAVVGAENGIFPCEGNGMLRMNPTGGVVSQIWQRVDVSIYGSQIDTGTGTVDLSASFNVLSGLTGVASRVIIGFYDASNVSTGSIVVVTEGSIGGLDPDPNTWQLISNLGAAVPVGTRILEAQFSYVNSTMQGQPGYVDAADMRLTVVPEPATISLLATTTLAALWRRRTTSIH